MTNVKVEGALTLVAGISGSLRDGLNLAAGGEVLGAARRGSRRRSRKKAAGGRSISEVPCMSNQQ